jgi:hypothetical protein
MIRVRTASLDDLDAVRAVSVRNGLSGFDCEERRRWWLSHPFQKEFDGVPIGWVLENSDGKIVGTFSNVHMMYEIDGQRFKCGIAGSWGVDAEYRSASLLLAASFFSQKGVDICFNGSASSVSSRLMPVMRAKKFEAADYDVSYLWITGHQSFAEAVLRKKNVPGAEVVSRAAGLVLSAADRWTVKCRSHNCSVKELGGFGEEFDYLWKTLSRKGRCFRGVRSAAALEWRFGEGLRTKHAIVLGATKNGKLSGYVVLCEKSREHLKLKEFVIKDLQVVDDSPELILDLLSAAIEVTRERGLDALEFQGWNAAKRKAALALRPRAYRYPVWPLYYTAINPELISTLACAEALDCSPFDAF